MQKWHIEIKAGWRREWEETITDYIAKRVKEARESENISQRQLSSIMSRSSAYVSLVESKRLNPTVLDLIGFVVALNRPLKYFLPLEETDEEELSGDEWELLAQYRKIQSDAIRQTARKQVAELAKLEKKK